MTGLEWAGRASWGRRACSLSQIFHTQREGKGGKVMVDMTCPLGPVEPSLVREGQRDLVGRL